MVLVAGQFPAFQLKDAESTSDMMDMLLVPGCNKTQSQSSPIGQIVKGRSKPILDTVVGVNFASSASKSAQNLNYAARNSEHPDLRYPENLCHILSCAVQLFVHHSDYSESFP